MPETKPRAPGGTNSISSEMRKREPQLGQEAEHLPRHRLDIVLPANDNEAGDLVADQHLVLDRHRVLHAVQALGAGAILGADADFAAQGHAAPAARCWPHHFDVASQIAFTASSGQTAYVGAGFSPGDTFYKEPYFYVTLYPKASVEGLPSLAPNGRLSGG